ncbi:MAG: acyltransferase, partial [Prevotellaceae bacterium]|nr:acyltransferase [Candidatus Colivivens equi]
MVVLYHLFVVDSTTIIWKIFFAGYLGVDIFLFLSGYGLSYSFNKNSLYQFYVRRIYRFVPLIIILGLCVNIVFILQGLELSYWDMFCNITTLNYYKLRGKMFEWYLSSLILFYAFYPLLYRSIKVKGFLYKILLFAILVIFLYLTTTNIDVYYLCAIGRIPIFLIGIHAYKNVLHLNLTLMNILVVYTLGTIISIPLYCLHIIPTFAMIYCLAPFVICAIVFFAKKIINCERINRLVSWLGENSIEIYVSNVIVCEIVKSDFFSMPRFGQYFILHII